MTRIRNALANVFSHTFRFFEALGIHVTRANFNSPIPLVRELDHALFDRQSECVGVNWNIDVQRWYLREVFSKFACEIAFQKNPGLSLVDSAILHAMIRHHKPRQVIEIGSGSSTQVAANACLMNEKEGKPSDLIVIDPYPGSLVEKGFPGLIKLRKEKVQHISVKEFTDCELLFIDSSHVVKIGSDVNYEILEIIPRLKKGCLIHFHDILMPGEYWNDWVLERHLFWTEQYLLWAFLSFNETFKVVWGSRYMHLTNRKEIEAVFPFFRPGEHRITSFWIRREV